MSFANFASDREGALERTNAVLFCRLAELVVWGQQHREVSARYPELAYLISNAGSALAVAARPDAGIPSSRFQNTVANTENIACSSPMMADCLHAEREDD